MAEEAQQTCYEGTYVDSFQFYLDHSGELQAILKCFHDVMPGEFQRIAAGKSSLDVLGVGSGGGEKDIELITHLQSVSPNVPITADIVEGSVPLTDKFKALVAKTANVQKVPFAWHVMGSEAYEKQVKAKGDVKKFDFIHMIQMVYYVENLCNTIKFYHSLLKSNGRLMIIVETAGGGWDTLWKTYTKELCKAPITAYHSSKEVIACLKNLGLKYEEYAIPNSYDITECFDPSSQNGNQLLYFKTEQHFYQSFTPEIRAGILDLLRNKCSTVKDGRVIFNNHMSCIIIHAPADAGFDTLWKTYKKELCVAPITEYRSSKEVIDCVKNLGLKYEEHAIPLTYDITDCFNPSSQTGTHLLNFMTAQPFYQSFTPETRAGMLDLLRNKCSAVKDGKVIFNNHLSCIFIHA